MIYLSILIRIISVLIIVLFIIPLQIKEAKVKNGLALLRTQLLLYGVTLSAIVSISIVEFILIDPSNADILVLINSFLFFGLAFVGYKIYHQQYTPKNRELHEKLENLEKKSKK